MQRVTLVRYATKPGAASENEKLSRAVFEELRAKPPKDVAYALLRQGDEFAHLFVNMREADSEAVVGLPTFKAFQKNSGDRFAAEPEIVRFDFNLVDSYGFARP